MRYKLKLSYFKKIWNDQKYILLWLIVFSFAFEFAFAWLLFEAKFNELFDSVAHMLPPSLLNFIGVSLSGEYYGSQMLSFGYSHPLILISLSLLPIGLSARYIAGEVENKTFDILLTRSVPRSVIPTHLFTFITMALIFQSIALFSGTALGYILFDLQIDLGEYAKVTLITFLFFLSMGSIAMAISTFQWERGKALSITVSLMVLLYFYDTIIRLNTSLEHLISYSYFNLYQPGKLIRGQIDAGISILFLVIIIVLFLLLSIFRFNQRDL